MFYHTTFSSGTAVIPLGHTVLGHPCSGASANSMIMCCEINWTKSSSVLSSGRDMTYYCLLSAHFRCFGKNRVMYVCLP